MACESVQDILDTLITVEALSVAVLGEALESASRGKLVLDTEQLLSFRASRAAKQAHYLFLKSSGARLATMAFSVAPEVIASRDLFFKMMITLEEASVAAYIAAAQTFALLNQPKWVQHSLAMGAVAAENRVLVRVFAIGIGALEGPPNDVGFEKAKYASMAAAKVDLDRMGFLGGRGRHISYPGPGAIDRTGLKHLHP